MTKKTTFKCPRYFRLEVEKMDASGVLKEQVNNIVDCAEQIFDREDLADIVLFAAYHGLRQSEIFKLKARDIDFVEKIILLAAALVSRQGEEPSHGSLPQLLWSMLADRCLGANEDLYIFGDEWNDRFQL